MPRNCEGTEQLQKNMKLISVVTFALILFAGFGESFLIGKGHIPFGLELSKAGPFMNVQFMAVFLVNFILCLLALYQYQKGVSTIHFGWFVSVATMYLSVLYGDILRRLDTVQ